ncbi:MAG: cytochrome-c peroxidase [Weeksellaceae bacterium]
MKKAIILMGAFMMLSCNGKVESQEDAVEIPLTKLQTQAKALFGVLPDLADNPDNPVTEEKVFLGQSLYFDPILSKNQTQSCNTCHNLSTFGVDNLPFSPGDAEGTIGGRNSPTTFNAALHIAQFWDGRANSVEEQAGGPILNPVEMGMPNEEAALERLRGSEKYQKLFATAYPNDDNPISWENLTSAIGAFERMLVTPTRFDKFITGDDDALTNREKQGLEDFISNGCVTCHSGVGLGGHIFQKFGVYQDYWIETKSENVDEGLASVSKLEADKNVFKVPGLRNITKTYPYFHDGSVRDLKEAVRIMGKIQLNRELTEEQAENITVFFDALTGEIDPKYAENPNL